MLGRTPPEAIVVDARSLLSSSSLRMASWRWRGTIRAFPLSIAALPASSRISAVRYSRTPARYTGAPAPTRAAYLPFRSIRWTRPTGNTSPAREDRDRGVDDFADDGDFAGDDPAGDDPYAAFSSGDIPRHIPPSTLLISPPLISGFSLPTCGRIAF